MATKKVLIDIQVSSAGAKQALNETGRAVDDVKIKTDLYTKSIDELTQSERDQLIQERKGQIQKAITAKQIDELAMAEMRAADATNAHRAQAGLNNAILIEASRLASDANYGFTAMANNLGQLATLFAQFARTSGGAVASLKQLFKSLIGSGGVLIAVQLLIAFLPKILEFFNKSSEAARKLKEDVEGATKAIQDQIDVIETIEGRIGDFVGTTDLLRENILFFADEFPEFEDFFNRLESYDDTALQSLSELFTKLQKQRVQQIADDVKLKHLREEIAEINEKGDELTAEDRKQRTLLETELSIASIKRIKLREKERDTLRQINSLLSQDIEPFALEEGLEIEIDFDVDVAKENLLNRFGDFYEDLDLKVPILFEPDFDTELYNFMNNFQRQSALESIEIQRDRSLEELDILYEQLGHEIGIMEDRDQINAYYDSLRDERLQNELEILSDATHAMSQIFGEQTAAHKAFAISTALIDTYVGANKALKDETIPNTFARIAAVTAVIATGIANVTKILDVDENGQRSVTTGTGGRQVAAPAFNIVGTSPISQLGTAVAGQAGEPTRAYVVFKDIQNAEQWETETSNRITLG